LRDRVVGESGLELKLTLLGCSGRTRSHRGLHLRRRLDRAPAAEVGARQDQAGNALRIVEREFLRDHPAH
jgi:hypothetical protein